MSISEPIYDISLRHPTILGLDTRQNSLNRFLKQFKKGKYSNYRLHGVPTDLLIDYLEKTDKKQITYTFSEKLYDTFVEFGPKLWLVKTILGDQSESFTLYEIISQQYEIDSDYAMMNWREITDLAVISERLGGRKLDSFKESLTWTTTRVVWNSNTVIDSVGCSDFLGLGPTIYNVVVFNNPKGKLLDLWVPCSSKYEVLMHILQMPNVSLKSAFQYTISDSTTTESSTPSTTTVAVSTPVATSSLQIVSGVDYLTGVVQEPIATSTTTTTTTNSKLTSLFK